MEKWALSALVFGGGGSADSYCLENLDRRIRRAKVYGLGCVSSWLSFDIDDVKWEKPMTTGSILLCCCVMSLFISSAGDNLRTYLSGLGLWCGWLAFWTVVVASMQVSSLKVLPLLEAVRSSGVTGHCHSNKTGKVFDALLSSHLRFVFLHSSSSSSSASASSSSSSSPSSSPSPSLFFFLVWGGGGLCWSVFFC